MLQSLARLQQVDPGFRSEDRLTLQVSLPYTGGQDSPRWAAFFERLLRRATVLPGVAAAGMVSELPLTSQANEAAVTILGEGDDNEVRAPAANLRRASPGYLKAMGIALERGRDFTDRDRSGSAQVALISESFANRHFPGRDPIGARIRIDREDWTGEIVGVVGSIRHQSLAQPPGLDVYVPHAQNPYPGMNLVVRSSVDPRSLVRWIEKEARAIDGDATVYDVRLMEEWVERSLSRPRLRAGLTGAFAALALTLACVGIYGVISYMVGQRVQEMGIRMALGAAPRDLLRLFLGEGVRLTAIGLGVGLAMALASTRVLSRLVFEVQATDPWTFGGVAGLLAVVALAACWIPARRASRLDPLAALRRE